MRRLACCLALAGCAYEPAHQAVGIAGGLSPPTAVAVEGTPVNHAPVALDARERATGSTVSITLVASDADNDPLSYEIVVPPGGGVLSGSGPQRVFTPAANEFGLQTFSFRVSDGMAVSNTATFAIEVLCGNEIIDRGEACDDGTANSDARRDACRTSCEPAHCGDGVVDIGEQCDDGSANSDSVPNTCRTTCRIASCGDGVLDENEQCDDGDGNSDSMLDACRTDCSVAHCGDRIVDAGEQCDPGPQAALFDQNACTSCAPNPPAGSSDSCSSPSVVLSEQLAAPSAGEDTVLFAELAAGDGSHAAPADLAWSQNANSVTRSLRLVSTKDGREVRWGYLTTQQLQATVQTPAGATFTEIWTLGWVHRTGDSGWTSVGALASRVRMLLDRAAQQVTVAPSFGNTDVPRFPSDKLWTACDGIRTDTSTGLAKLLPLLHPALLEQVFAVNGSQAMVNPGFETPDFEWREVRPVAIAVEGATAWTTIEGTYTVNNGLELSEQWILEWVYDTGVGAWSIWGIASTIERERLGELAFWWNKHRRAGDFGKDGLFGRSALIRVLSTNNTETGITYSASDPQTERAARRFVEGALARAHLQVLPANQSDAVDVLAAHLTGSFVDGSWRYNELNKLTFLRLSELKQGHCEVIIFFSGLLEWLGIRGHYVGNADSPSRFEIWRNGRFEDAALDASNTTWIWYGYSADERMQAVASPLPNIVTFPTDPYGFSVGRVLWWDTVIEPLFTHHDGLPCFDPKTFPFDQIAYEPIR